MSSVHLSLVIALVVGSSSVARASTQPVGPASAPQFRFEPTDQQLRRRAIGLGVGATLLGITWLGLKGAATGENVRVQREIASGSRDPRDCAEGCSSGPLLHLSGLVFLIGSAAMLGAGLHAHGRLLGRQGRGLGRSSRNGRILVGVGSGLLVGGLALLTVGIVGGQRIDDGRGSLAINELGWWSVTGFGVAGAGITGLGHGLLRGERSRQAQVTALPSLGPTNLGIALVGRF